MITPPTSEMSIYQHLHRADKATVAAIVKAANAGQPLPNLPRGTTSERVAAAVQLRFAGWSRARIHAWMVLSGSQMKLICDHVDKHTAPTPCFECDERPARVAGRCTWCWDAAERRGET